MKRRTYKRAEFVKIFGRGITAMFKRVSYGGRDTDFGVGQSSVEIEQYKFFINFLL